MFGKRSKFNEPDAFNVRKKAGRTKRTIHTLLSPDQLSAAMARESARVDRKGGAALSLVLFRLPNPKSNNSRFSALRLAKTILKRIRLTDDVGYFDAQHLGVLLPETTVAGAWRLAQLVCDVVSKRGERPLVTMYTYPAEAVAAVGPNAKGVVRSDEPSASPMAQKIAI